MLTQILGVIERVYDLMMVRTKHWARGDELEGLFASGRDEAMPQLILERAITSYILDVLCVHVHECLAKANCQGPWQRRTAAAKVMASLSISFAPFK